MTEDEKQCRDNFLLYKFYGTDKELDETSPTVAICILCIIALCVVICYIAS